MRIKGISMLFVMILLCSCSSLPGNPLKGNAIIDWVDFVKLNGQTYDGLWEGVIRDPNEISNKIVGQVKFTVADVVSNPSYQTKDGDAAFLAKGTKLYQVKGFAADVLIAAKDEQHIGGYRLFVREGSDSSLHPSYMAITKKQVTRIDLFHGEELKPYKSLIDAEKEQFIHLLDKGKDTQNYNPQTQNGDPTYYKMVFYTDGPIAYAFSLADDGENVFFSPNQTRLVDAEIRKLMASDPKDL